MEIDKCHTLFHTVEIDLSQLADQCVEQFEFSEEKDQLLRAERGVGFREVIQAIQNKNVLALIDHHNVPKYSHQRVYVLDINNYAYLVPFVKKDEKTIFLKTIFPSRKFTKKYLFKEGVICQKE